MAKDLRELRERVDYAMHTARDVAIGLEHLRDLVNLVDKTDSPEFVYLIMRLSIDRFESEYLRMSDHMKKVRVMVAGLNEEDVELKKI